MHSRRLPEKGRFAALIREHNKVVEDIQSLQPIESLGVETQHTRLGVIRKVKPSVSEGTGGGDPVWL